MSRSPKPLVTTWTGIIRARRFHRTLREPEQICLAAAAKALPNLSAFNAIYRYLSSLIHNDSAVPYSSDLAVIR